MKKLFFTLAFMLIGSYGFAETNCSTNVIKSNYSSFNSVLGICHIEITYTDSRGNTHTDVWDLPCNTAAECKQMLTRTLAAY